jgi:hypothetical protein
VRFLSLLLLSALPGVSLRRAWAWSARRLVRNAGPCLVLAALTAATAEPAQDLAGVVTAADLDLAACKAWTDGKETPGNWGKGVLAALGLDEGQGWAAGRQDEGKSRDYLIVFKKPVAVGAVLFQHGGVLKMLRKETALPADPARADAWEEVKFPPSQSGWRLAALPAGTATQAFLCSLSHGWGDWHRWALLRVLGPRFHNVAPEGLANGEAEYTEFHDLGPPTFFRAAHIVAGSGAWQSHGPNKDKRIPRAPVSDIDPTWFVISWDEPKAISAVLLKSNFRKFQLFAYQGAPGVNPAVGTDADWGKVRYSVRDDAGIRWLTFRPLSTRGLKFLVVDAGDRFGRIEGLHAWVDLKAAPVPPRGASSSAPPLKITCRIPADGTFSLALDDAQGGRVRNLSAREECRAGDLEAGWDLKNEDGTFVQPGLYRWTAIVNPGLQLKYEMTPYPNVEAHAPGNSPWLNGAGGPGGWLADHTPPSAVCPVGGRVFLSAPCAESGVALIECDPQGRKLWGHHNMMAWTGPGMMAGDDQALYCVPWTSGHDYVWRFTLPDKKFDTLLDLGATAARRRGAKGLAVRDGKLYLSVNAGANWMDNAASAGDVDLDRCVPRYAPPKKGGKEDDPDPRSDFLRLFRLTGTPPGCNGLIRLETSEDSSPRQHLVLSFNKPVPLGTLVFPAPDEAKLNVRLSALKADGAYPPKPRKEGDWNVFWKGTPRGWMAVAAPENTTTRALRISFDQGLDELDEAALKNEQEEVRLDAEEGLGKKDDLGLARPKWRARIEGVKLLRRRFVNLFPTCQVAVNSGKVTPEGEWDAQRDRPLTRANPGIYMLSWDAPQAFRGLAIKEIDSRFTEIDAWTGDGAPDLRADKGWEKVAVYEQPTRFYYQPDAVHNSKARYVDGYVDFGRDVKTRALRLRVVEQWMWKEEDRAGCAGVRKDRGGEELDPTRCRIYGVAPLGCLGGDAPVDPLTTGRIEVWDIEARKLVRETPLESGGDLAFGPAGELYAVSGDQVVKAALEAGRHAPLNLDVKQPRALAVDKAGNLYVYDSAADRRVVKAFDPAGKALRTIGTPGGRIAGPWDPTRFASHPGVAVDLAVDREDQLWVVECDYTPKRVSLWSLDGTFKKDFFGNTSYGGGGCLDPYDKSRLFVGPMEFSLDWKTGATALKSMTWLGNSPAGEVPIRIGDRVYLVTRPLFDKQAVGVVYRYDAGRLKRVAAVGRAGNFEPLRAPEILDRLGKKAIGYQAFAWSDRNDDGDAQADEVQFFEVGDARREAVLRFEETLSVDSGAFRYEVKEFLPNGAPVYERKPKPFGDSAYRTAGDQYFVSGDSGLMKAKAADGRLVWTHPAEGWGVHALYSAKPWFPGQVVAQFGIVGHETAHAGDLGEFFVTHSNTGAWHVWSADGLLAGRIFRDMRGPGATPWSMRSAPRGLDLTGVTCGQEHFSGYFCRTRQDNKYYVVAGHNHASVVEVQGIEGIKRIGGELNVTPADVKTAIEWDRAAQARKLYEAAKVIECRRARRAVKLDGEPGEWDFESASLPGRDVSFALSYDDRELYVCCQVKGHGPLRNAGNDWKRLFKTGAAVDLQIGLDPKAPADRKTPAVGDTRLLMTLVNDRPVAVLYQPNAPGAGPDAKWETHTMVYKAEFDRVQKLEGVRIAVGGAPGGYCLEAAIPLAALGLKIAPDLRLKLDLGILVSGPDGTETFQRLYWANQQTAIVSDEAAEAMLQPELWGFVRFSGKVGKEGLAPEVDIEKATRKGGREDVEDLKIEE